MLSIRSETVPRMRSILMGMKHEQMETGTKMQAQVAKLQEELEKE